MGGADLDAGGGPGDCPAPPQAAHPAGTDPGSASFDLGPNRTLWPGMYTKKVTFMFVLFSWLLPKEEEISGYKDIKNSLFCCVSVFGSRASKKGMSPRCVQDCVAATRNLLSFRYRARNSAPVELVSGPTHTSQITSETDTLPSVREQDDGNNTSPSDDNVFESPSSTLETRAQVLNKLLCAGLQLAFDGHSCVL